MVCYPNVKDNRVQDLGFIRNKNVRITTFNVNHGCMQVVPLPKTEPSQAVAFFKTTHLRLQDKDSWGLFYFYFLSHGFWRKFQGLLINMAMVSGESCKCTQQILSELQTSKVAVLAYVVLRCECRVATSKPIWKSRSNFSQTSIN